MAEKNEEQVVEAPKARSPWLMAFVVGLLGAAVGGGAAFVAVSRTPGAVPGAEEEAEPATAVEGSFSERVSSLDPFVVNVSGEGYPRYVKVQLAFEMDSPEAKDELEGHMAKVRDLTILLLSSRRLADIEDFEGKALLKDDLRERVNGVLSQGRVESVLFTEFVVQ